MRVVPVIGSGVNIQAARMAGAPAAADWAGLLKHILKHCGLAAQCVQTLPEPFIQRWEAIVRLVTEQDRGWQPYKTEKELQQQVQRNLRSTEARYCRYALYSKFIRAGFRDIIEILRHLSFQLVLQVLASERHQRRWTNLRILLR